MTFTAAVDGFVRDVDLVVRTVCADVDRCYGKTRDTALRVMQPENAMLLDMAALRECVSVVRFVALWDVEALDAAERLHAAIRASEHR